MDDIFVTHEINMSQDIIQVVIASRCHSMDKIMEVRGSVIVGDDDDQVVSTQIKGGFADLGRLLEPHEKDDVPRVLVKSFRKHTKPFKLHLVFSKFGTVTYLAVKDQKAVVEFSSREAVQEVLRCKFLKIQGARIESQLLQRFLHVEKDQFEVHLHPELAELGSKEAFDAFTEQVCKQSTACCSDDWKTVCQAIERYARHAYPKCKVYPFGSRITQLGLEGCDLDVFLDCGKMYDGTCRDTPKDQQILGETVLKALLRCQDFSRIYKVLHARVPILKFYYLPTKTYGDIAFRNGLGVENSKLLIFLQSLDSRVRPFFLFVKTWARLQNLRTVTETKNFTSYSIIMMAVFYLQQLAEPVLPPIRRLMEMYQGQRTIIAGWPCSFIGEKQAVPKAKNNSSVLELTKGFFQYYRSFHFEWKIVCPYLGKAIERQDMEDFCKSWEGDLSLWFQTYTENLQQEDCEYFPTRVPVCVQDPFEHSHNLTRGVKEEVLMNFVSSCGLMYEKLCTF